MATLEQNLWAVLNLFIFVWVYSWAKSQLGSAKLAILFALIVVYLSVISFPFLTWMLAGLFLLTTFGSEIMGRINPWEGGDQIR